jgi:hypothetical protein
MKNIHLLPTDKPSRLGRFIDTGKLSLRTDNDIPRGENINIYITSDEEIKEGDWVLGGLGGIDIKKYGRYFAEDWKKIILTTDQDLIADGVQSIDDEFLEWFVKNPSCESVVVNFNYKKFRWSELNKSQCYKIIIPQEEPKQETLEEASSRLLYSKYPFHPPQDSGYWKDMFIEGAKWQQERMYSEKEVYDLLRQFPNEEELDLWFEQNKKK